MDKPTSIIAALNAGKLPSTEQFNQFIAYFQQLAKGDNVPVLQDATPPSVARELSARGQVFADDIGLVLNADKTLLNNKNADNVLQDAIWHLSQATVTTTTTNSEQLEHLSQIQQSLRILLTSLSHSLVSSSSSLLSQPLSLIRSTLSDAFQLVEGTASSAKSNLREVEGQVQQGKRDQWGRDKASLEQEQDPKVAWEHGVESLKVAGSSAIGGYQATKEGIQAGQDKLESELKETYYSIWKHAQSDPEYRKALDTLISTLQSRLDSASSTASSQISLSTFVTDSSEEQHLSKGLVSLRTFIERLAQGKSLQPLIDALCNAMSEIVGDPPLKKWFDDYFTYARTALADVQFAHSEEAKTTRKELTTRWKKLTSTDENSKWSKLVENIKSERSAFESALEQDEDLQAVKASKQRLSDDLKAGFSQLNKGVEDALEEATWFWQDLFKVYLPSLLSELKQLPIPRTEYKDDDIEFVLENLDISHLNILPSKVYIRNITDVSIQTASSDSGSNKQVATLTHIQLQAVQMHLRDVSFWYKDKHAMTSTVGEFAGLLEMKLPAKGINVDLKVRMIPSQARGDLSRDRKHRFHIIEKCTVEISDDVQVSVKETNHPLLLTVFSGLVKTRIKLAMERTLSGQLEAMVDWLDHVAFDVAERKRVFEDVGLGAGPALMAGLWSEIGKMERKADEEGFEVGVTATGTGFVFEQSKEVPSASKTDEKFEYETGTKREERVLAVGLEPQVLSGEKRGPLGTGSGPLSSSEDVSSSMMDVDVSSTMGMAAEELSTIKEKGKEKMEGFRKAVLKKEQEERKSVGKTWKSDAFDI